GSELPSERGYGANRRYDVLRNASAKASDDAGRVGCALDAVALREQHAVQSALLETCASPVGSAPVRKPLAGDEECDRMLRGDGECIARRPCFHDAQSGFAKRSADRDRRFRRGDQQATHLMSIRTEAVGHRLSAHTKPLDVLLSEPVAVRAWAPCAGHLLLRLGWATAGGGRRLERC